MTAMTARGDNRDSKDSNDRARRVAIRLALRRRRCSHSTRRQRHRFPDWNPTHRFSAASRVSTVLPRPLITVTVTVTSIFGRVAQLVLCQPNVLRYSPGCPNTPKATSLLTVRKVLKVLYEP